MIRTRNMDSPTTVDEEPLFHGNAPLCGGLGVVVDNLVVRHFRNLALGRTLGGENEGGARYSRVVETCLSEQLVRANSVCRTSHCVSLITKLPCFLRHEFCHKNGQRP